MDIFIGRKDCTLYKTENTWVLENTRFTSPVEHLNMAFTMIFISYSYIIRLVRYLGDEI